MPTFLPRLAETAKLRSFEMPNSALSHSPLGSRPPPASGQHDDEAFEASTDNDAAVAAYRLSVQAGNPLSERRLAQMFGRTSRRWARARIAVARQPSPLPDSPGTPVTAEPQALAASRRANPEAKPAA